MAQKPKPQFQDKDTGYEELKTIFKYGKKGRAVKVGFLKRSGKHKDSSLTVAQIASFHEFGTARVPERSFMRSTMDEKDQDLKSLTQKLLKSVIFQRKTLDEALLELGANIQKWFRNKITQGLKPPLETATINRKGSSKPLIDTGQLINSIDYEVEK